MSNMKDYINKVESWIEQVRDDELGVEDYDFIDSIVHKGRDGNNGLAQVGVYLAIYEEDGELQVDEELIDYLDSQQEELPQGGLNRFSNIVYKGETQKREDKTLMDREIDGHERLYKMLDAAKENLGDLTTKPAPEPEMPDGANDRLNKSSVTIQSLRGDKSEMSTTPSEVERAAAVLDGTRQNNEDITREEVSAVDTLVEYIGDAQKTEAQRDEMASDYVETLRSFQSYLDQQYEVLDEASQNVQYAVQTLDDIDVWDDMPNTDTMQDNMRNPSF